MQIWIKNRILLKITTFETAGSIVFQVSCFWSSLLTFVFINWIELIDVMYVAAAQLLAYLPQITTMITKELHCAASCFVTLLCADCPTQPELGLQVPPRSGYSTVCIVSRTNALSIMFLRLLVRVWESAADFTIQISHFSSTKTVWSHTWNYAVSNPKLSPLQVKKDQAEAWL